MPRCMELRELPAPAREYACVLGFYLGDGYIKTGWRPQQKKSGFSGSCARMRGLACRTSARAH
jgi:hypothetical protein